MLSAWFRGGEEEVKVGATRVSPNLLSYRLVIALDFGQRLIIPYKSLTYFDMETN